MFPKRSPLYWREAADMSAARKRSASLNFTAQARCIFLQFRDLKARRTSKIFYALVKCGIGACVALEQAAKISL